jgi:hypothetical protein
MPNDSVGSKKRRILASQRATGSSWAKWQKRLTNTTELYNGFDWKAKRSQVAEYQRAACYRFPHCSATANEVIQIVSLAFKKNGDDTDLVHTAELDAIGEDIYEEMQDIFDTWEGGGLSKLHRRWPSSTKEELLVYYHWLQRCSLNGK